MAPDGDAFLTDEQVRNFQVPACRKCGGILKPDVTFFGDTVSREKVDFVHQRLAESDSMLVAGSSMQVARSSSHASFCFCTALSAAALGPVAEDSCFAGRSPQPLQLLSNYCCWYLDPQLSCLGFPATPLPTVSVTLL